MNRRAFLCGLTLGIMAAPLAAEAQEAGKTWRIGFLSPYSADFDKTWRAALWHGLRDLGYVEGKSIIIEQRHADGTIERLPQLAQELVVNEHEVVFTREPIQRRLPTNPTLRTNCIVVLEPAGHAPT